MKKKSETAKENSTEPLQNNDSSNSEKYCKNCRWSKPVGDAYYHTYYCIKPEVQRKDPVTGPSRQRDCYIAVADCNYQYWEKKPGPNIKKQNPIKQFFFG